MKKHITEITNEWKGFWQPLFDKLGIPYPAFYAKLGYMGNEFGEKTPCVRFFASELSIGRDVYVELFDWEQNFYHGSQRILYKLSYNPDWETCEDYIKVFGANIISYAVRLSKLEIVNKSLSTAAYPNLDDIEELPIFAINFDTINDQNFSTMTIRDFYCILHQKPLSEKKWLNKLINKGKYD